MYLKGLGTATDEKLAFTHYKVGATSCIDADALCCEMRSCATVLALLVFDDEIR
jgi:hypothetical protein